MIKILYFTDVHYSRIPPEGRTDTYAEDIRTKMAEVLKVSEKFKPDLILSSADFFHRKEKATHGDCGDVAEMLQAFGQPIICVLGSHDVPGHQIEGRFNRAVGTLEKVGLINVVDDNPYLFEKDDYKLLIAGKSCHVGYEQPESYGVGANKGDADTLIWLSHGVLTKDEKLPYEHTSISCVLGKTNADMILNGHMHSHVWGVEKDGKIAINAGSIGRTQRGDEHKPSVVVIKIDNGIKYKMIPLLCAKDAEEIYLVQQKSSLVSDEDVKAFVQALQDESGDMKSEDLKVALETASEGKSREVKNAVMARLEKG